MNWIDETLEEFGRSIGVGPLRAGPDGGVSLNMGEEGRLSFQIGADEVLVMFARSLAPGSQLTLKLRALELCHRKHGWALPVRAGLSRDRLVFFCRLPAREFHLPMLEQALELLTRLHDQLTH